MVKHPLKSRKFWMAVVGAALVILNDGLGFDIDSETVLAFTALVISYILGEGIVDAMKKGER